MLINVGDLGKAFFGQTSLPTHILKSFPDELTIRAFRIVHFLFSNIEVRLSSEYCNRIDPDLADSVEKLRLRDRSQGE